MSVIGNYASELTWLKKNKKNPTASIFSDTAKKSQYYAKHGILAGVTLKQSLINSPRISPSDDEDSMIVMKK